MSNETDLDWLARNVHAWPTNTPKAILSGDATFKLGAVFYGDCVAFSGELGTEYRRVNKADWLARRAELQNKPKWEKATSWANWLAQDSNGYWWWFESKPSIMAFGSKSEWSTHSCGGRYVSPHDCKRGEVLGSWRDTLEKRPADLSEPAVTKRLDEATQIVRAAVPELVKEKYRFEPEFMPVSVSNETVQLERPVAVAGTGNGSAAESAFLIVRVIDLLRTSVDHFSANELAELHQLCDAELTKRDAAVCGGQKYLDAQWFERGELPPVGEVCETYLDYPPQWIETEIVAHKDGFAIGWCKSVMKGCHGDKAREFRPIRTERDVLIEVLKGTHAASLTNLDMLASAILAAGFKRDGGAA